MDPYPASEWGSGTSYLNISAKNRNLVWLAKFSEKKIWFSSTFFPLRHSFAYKNIQMVKVSLTKKKPKYSLGAQGRPSDLRINIRKSVLLVFCSPLLNKIRTRCLMETLPGSGSAKKEYGSATLQKSPFKKKHNCYLVIRVILHDLGSSSRLSGWHRERFFKMVHIFTRCIPTTGGWNKY
jgi:hypothetical protein